VGAVVKGKMTMNTSMILSQPVAIATDNLIATLLQSEPIAAYLHAKAVRDTDKTTQVLLNHYGKVLSELRQQEAKGTLTQESISQFNQLQRQVQTDQNVAALSAAQLPARTLLNELATELSDVLGLDFSSIANTSTC
jgi:cell fate (sporulation/competence/biofilm development) regulator YlbF (YheA/YmcA/DUF963 family)